MYEIVSAFPRNAPLLRLSLVNVTRGSPTNGGYDLGGAEPLHIAAGGGMVHRGALAAARQMTPISGGSVIQYSHEEVRVWPTV